MLVAQPAAAHDQVLPSFAPSCHAPAPLDATASAMIARGEWTCTNDGWRSDVPAMWLRFDAQAWNGELAPR